MLAPRASGQPLDLSDPRSALTQYKIDVWQTEQGLPLNTVQCLLQTRDGYLWVGTGGGLARFDGVRFATFKPPDVMTLASQPVFGLKEDLDGNLWIGYSGGAAIYRDGRFRVAFGAEVTSGRRVWSFSQAADGAMWAATEGGLVRWENGRTRVYHTGDGLPTDRLRSLTFDRDGVLWLGTTGGGLVSFANGRFTSFTPENGFPHLEVRYVLADPSGGIWAATAGGGLARVNAGTITTYTVANGLPTDQLTSLAWDDQKSLWIGTWGEGVCRMRDGRFTSLSTAGGLAGGQIWSLHADREGSVWVGTWVGGLNRLRNRHFVVLGASEGLSSDNTRSVVHGRDGVTWVGTAGGGVNRIQNGRVTAITKKDGLASDETSCLYEDRDGSLWIGTYTAGIARLRPDGRIENYGIEQGLQHLDVRALMQDRSGTLWAGTRGGLARFDGKAFVPMRAPGLPADGISAILQDRSGTLWFGTTGEGLVRYRDGVFQTFTRRDGLVSNWIMALYEDQDGALWIGTNGAGMNRLKNGKIAGITTANGLWDGIAQSILEDRSGQLWMTCNRGFYRVSRDELDAFADRRARRVNSVGFGPGDALRSTTFAGGHQPAGAIDANGHLWLPSFSGLVIVDPARLPGSGAPPDVSLEDVVVSGADVPHGAPVVLPSGAVPLAIRYTAMTLMNSDRAQFRYRMDGITRDWIDAGRSREAFFPTLPHGTYRFRVAASLDGKQWREAAPLTITVKPRFFETLWFIALVVLLLLAATASVLWLRTRQLHHRQSEMERLVAEKTEALRLANEHLARLSFSDSLTGLANRRRFDEALEQEWRRACRFGTSLALIMADVDLFKDFNDTLGHREGDRCLAAVADVFLKSGRRAGDLVARYGGEEFAVLIPSADHAAAFAFAEALRKMCEDRAIPHPAPPVGRVVTISLGVAACVPAEHTSSDELVLAADAALYRAKRMGRNQVA